MIGLRRLICALAASAGMTWTSPSDANLASTEAIDRLEVASRAHPDDPDLAWALARKLASAGRAADAVRQTRHFLERWPERRPGARVDIARSLIESDASAAALDLLDDELSSNPLSATARLYRALAFRSEGLHAEANREFVVAGRLEPALRAETLLARALGLFEMGREDEAVALLKEILEQDPRQGETAVRARLILRQRELLDLRRSWRVDGYAGFEWDDNVTLEGSENEVLASGSADFRGIWGVGGSWQPLLTEKTSLVLGYRYDQTAHEDLSEYDVLSNTAFVSGSWRPAERLALRLDAIVFNTLQDFDNELTGGTIRPNLVYSFGPDWGALRLFTQVDLLEYDDTPLFEAWERDAVVVSVAAEHFIPLPAKGSSITFGGSWSRTITQSDASGASDGFDGDFDYDGWRALARSHLLLPWHIEAHIDASYTHDRYRNDNLSYAISTLDTKKRRDDILSGRIGLSRHVAPHVEIEVYWRGTRRISNVDLFDYDKQLVGALVRFSTE